MKNVNVTAEKHSLTKKNLHGELTRESIFTVDGYDWRLTTSKRSNGGASSSVTRTKNTTQEGSGFSSFSFMMFEDPSMVLALNRSAKRVTAKVIDETHEAAIKVWESIQELPTTYESGKTLEKQIVKVL